MHLGLLKRVHIENKDYVDIMKAPKVDESLRLMTQMFRDILSKYPHNELIEILKTTNGIQ